ncbi:hypothetical protein [Ruegeria conchae]|uniref:hypothetical protein n=1 Tax=Ruegeria conchae TaxID=981384 RepID=UPI0021A4E771|nr:hypothetical protein [Ruegeria conchae]
MPKVILITGTSTGLGVQIAVHAAQAGHIFYATMRNLAKRGTLDAALAGAEPRVTDAALCLKARLDSGS